MRSVRGRGSHGCRGTGGELRLLCWRGEAFVGVVALLALLGWLSLGVLFLGCHVVLHVQFLWLLYDFGGLLKKGLIALFCLSFDARAISCSLDWRLDWENWAGSWARTACYSRTTSTREVWWSILYPRCLLVEWWYRSFLQSLVPHVLHIPAISLLLSFICVSVGIALCVMTWFGLEARQLLVFLAHYRDPGTNFIVVRLPALIILLIKHFEVLLLDFIEIFLLLLHFFHGLRPGTLWSIVRVFWNILRNVHLLHHRYLFLVILGLIELNSGALQLLIAILWIQVGVLRDSLLFWLAALVFDLLTQLFALVFLSRSVELHFWAQVAIKLEIEAGSRLGPDLLDATEVLLLSGRVQLGGADESS